MRKQERPERLVGILENYEYYGYTPVIFWINTILDAKKDIPSHITLRKAERGYDEMLWDVFVLGEGKPTFDPSEFREVGRYSIRDLVDVIDDFAKTGERPRDISFVVDRKRGRYTHYRMYVFP